MLKHAVKMLASGEYGCKCGLVWDKDEGDECPARKLAIERINHPAVGSQEAIENGATMHQFLGTQTLTDEICAALTQRDQPALAYRQKLAARLRVTVPTGCTFCGSDEHMTAVCPMRVEYSIGAFERMQTAIAEQAREIERLSTKLRSALLDSAELAASAPNHGEQVREGWKLMPVNSTEAMRDAINMLCDDSTAFDDSEAFWHYLLAAAPSAGSQREEEE